MYFAEPVGGSSCIAVVMIWTTRALHGAWWVTLDARQLSNSGDMPRPGTDGQQTQEGETRLLFLPGQFGLQAVVLRVYGSCLLDINGGMEGLSPHTTSAKKDCDSQLFGDRRLARAALSTNALFLYTVSVESDAPDCNLQRREPDRAVTALAGPLYACDWIMMRLS